MSQHRAWVFKTPHLKDTTNHRDDNYKLVDVCLATTAAPIYRSMAAINHPDNSSSGFNVFVDGGLWANNPVLTGLIDALDMTVPGQEIQVFCLGTCPLPAGEQITKSALDRGLAEWKFGGEAASLAVDAQQFAYDHMAKKLARHLNRICTIIRFPSEKVPAALIPYLDLDGNPRRSDGGAHQPGPHRRGYDQQQMRLRRDRRRGGVDLRSVQHRPASNRSSGVSDFIRRRRDGRVTQKSR